MGSATVALALLQPAGPPALWSGRSVVDRLRAAMVHRSEDVYFRPVVQADSIAGLRWRIAKLRWPFALETRAFALGLFALGSRAWMPSDDRAEAYAFFQQRLAATGFSEETIANLDYTFYTGLRLAGGFDPSSIDVAATPGFRQLAKVLDRASLFHLHLGAATLATLEPSMVKNPLVLREIARSATKSADGLVAAASELGFALS